MENAKGDAKAEKESDLERLNAFPFGTIDLYQNFFTALLASVGARRLPRNRVGPSIALVGGWQRQTVSDARWSTREQESDAAAVNVFSFLSIAPLLTFTTVFYCLYWQSL